MHFTGLFFLLVAATSCAGKKQTDAPGGPVVSANTIPVSNSGLDTSAYTVIPFRDTDQWLFKNAKPATLSLAEIIAVESLLAEAMQEHNKISKGMMVLQPVEKYKLQLVPVMNEKGEKIVFVSCFCGGNPDAFFKDWRTQLVMVDDGGSCFFNVKINLSAKKSYELMVNGVG